ncbi:MAG: metallo-beta-lactamase family protein [Myxococcota bacterium]|jgi:metallo-beta-lactamase family protein
MRNPTLQFLGAAGTVTGSRTLISDDDHRVLVDCGLFQGFKQLRLQNWDRFPVEPASLDAIVLTHAHIDHSGYLPRLVKQGFTGRVYCSAATADLCGLLLPDSGYLMEEEAKRANRYEYSRHSPALPLYTAAEAKAALAHLHPVPVDTDVPLMDGISLRFVRAGHIPGACSAVISWRGRRLGFSGDLGRTDDPLLGSPTPLPDLDALVVESTYGDRHHSDADPEADLGAIIRRTVARGGHVIVPAFAVGRTQRLLYHLHQLRTRGKIPPVPIWLDSPLADGATQVFTKHAAEYGLSEEQAADIAGVARVASTREQSMALDRLTSPAIMIAGSGMISGGRVLHHLRVYGHDPRHTILLTGFQAGGTRGASLQAGKHTVRIFGMPVVIDAEVRTLHNLSAHADTDELMHWLAACDAPPNHTFVNHGEPVAADGLRHRIETELGWKVTVPWHHQSITLAS